MSPPGREPARVLSLALILWLSAAEWVQISQQHYRKPVRVESTTQHSLTLEDTHKATRNTYLNQHVLEAPKRDYQNAQIPTTSYRQDVTLNPTKNTYLYHDVSIEKPTRDDVFDYDLPFQNPTRETYSNHSIAEYKWNQYVHPQNSRADRVTTREPNLNDWNENIQHRRNDKPDDRRQYETNDFSEKGEIKNETVSGKIERVTNIGSVKRVQLANTPIKSPSIKINKNPEIPNRRVNHGPQNYEYFSDELDIETNIFKDSHEEKIAFVPSNSSKHSFNNAEEVKVEETTKVPSINKSKTNIQINYFTPKPDFETVISEISKGNSKHPQNNASHVETAVQNKEDMKNIGINNKPIKPLKESATYDHIPDFLTNVKSKDFTIKTNRSNGNDLGSANSYKPHNKDDSGSEKGETVTSGEMKVKTMENVLKFIKVVAETISKNTRRGPGGKINYLSELKNTLLANIKERIDEAWPDDTSAGSRRRSRAASPRGHVEFPSSESSLMTISFLTFAVFLIKLVLQVIQTYKHKTMLMAPLMVATAGRAGVSKKLRNI